MMLIAVLAAAALQAASNGGPPPAAPASTASRDGTPRPAWRRGPSRAVMSESFPVRALQFGVAGGARMRCEVGVQGEMEHCSILEESPPGWGFGEAALELAPSFLMTAGLPDVSGHRPMVTIPMNWRKPEASPTLGGSDFGHLSHPRWLSAPSFADVTAAYPKEGGGLDGYVALTCNVVRYSGRLGRCVIRMEDPSDHGFAKAALSLTGKFQTIVPDKEQKKALAIWTGLRVRFPAPSAAGSANRRIENPAVLTDADPTAVANLYPAEAAARGLTSGEGFADCVVANDGTLSDCRPGEGSDQGFGEAAVKAASGVRLSLWTEGGQPVEGARADVPVKFGPAHSDER